MTKTIIHSLFILSILLIQSCSKSYIQIFDTSSNLSTENSFWTFENDTVKIQYSFLIERGIMSFSIFNKLEKPIFIDWKTSSFIYNSNKLNYWADQSETTSNKFYYGLLYKGGGNNNTINISGFANEWTNTYKPERITFIPPKSLYSRSQFYLVNNKKHIFSKNKYVKDFFHGNQTFIERYSDVTSPIKFRNYIAITFSENSSEYKFVDNEFYVKSVRELPLKVFRSIPDSNLINPRIFYLMKNIENEKRYQNEMLENCIIDNEIEIIQDESELQIEKLRNGAKYELKKYNSSEEISIGDIVQFDSKYGMKTMGKVSKITSRTEIEVTTYPSPGQKFLWKLKPEKLNKVIQ